MNSLPKIHLGCGETYLDGYVNIDFPPEEHTIASVHPDRYADVRTLDFEPGSVSEVRLHHLFEHFTRPESLALLVRWRKWLAPGGRLVIETPDAEGIARAFLKSKSIADKLGLQRHLFGSQEAKWAIHYDGWFEEKYRVVFEALGFDIEKILPFQNNITKRLGYQLSGVLDTMIKIIPGSIRKSIGLNDLPNILCIGKKSDKSINEHEAVEKLLALSLVGKEETSSGILSVWMKQYQEFSDQAVKAK
jgi:predicted SAM-dependent methyltransferase